MSIKAIAPAIGNLRKGSAHVRTGNHDGCKLLYAALKYMPRATSDEKTTGKPRVAGDFGVEEWQVTSMDQRMREVKSFNTMLNSPGLTTINDMGCLDGPYDETPCYSDRRLAAED